MPQAESFAIKFVRAQADNIGMLKEYKDQSKPVFLLFLDKTEKEKIEGPNLPELRKQISALAPPAAARQCAAAVAGAWSPRVFCVPSNTYHKTTQQFCGFCRTTHELQVHAGRRGGGQRPAAGEPAPASWIRGGLARSCWRTDSPWAPPTPICLPNGFTGV